MVAVFCVEQAVWPTTCSIYSHRVIFRAIKATQLVQSASFVSFSQVFNQSLHVAEVGDVLEAIEATICKLGEAVTDVWWDQKEEDTSPPNEEEPTNVSYIFPNGDRYEGECSRSLSGALVRNGTGKHTSANGVIYTGDWCNDKMQGRGTLQHPSGALYEGEFKDNMYHGMGIYTFPDASVYKGHFQMNRLEGDGTFVDAQGVVWKGEFHGKAALGLKMEHSV